LTAIFGPEASLLRRIRTLYPHMRHDEWSL
jgi:hypothetical protein